MFSLEGERREGQRLIGSCLLGEQRSEISETFCTIPK